MFHRTHPCAVHLLLDPLIDPNRLLRSLKGVTAREANKLLERTGNPFRQKESYDHCVRNDAEFGKIVAYIENNAVSVGLVHAPEEYPWSSAGHRHECRAQRALRTQECVRY